jgi:hypothetical protein
MSYPSLFSKNVHFLLLASSCIHRLKTENFRSSYLLVPEIKVLHTRLYIQPVEKGLIELTKERMSFPA